MKKTIAILSTIALIITLISCNQVEHTDNEYETATKEITSSVPNATNPPSLQSTTEGTTALQPDHSTSQNDYSSLLAPWSFATIADMEKYIATGSKNWDDYSAKPEMAENLPSHLRFQDYISPIAPLGLDVEQFDSNNSAIYTMFPITRYELYLDTLSIRLYQTQETSPKQLLFSLGTTDAEITNYPKNGSLGKASRYYVRQINDTEVVYYAKNGVINSVYFSIDGFIVRIRITTPYGWDQGDRAYVESMLATEKMAPVAPLFSRDAATVEAYINNVRAAIANQTTAS